MDGAEIDDLRTALQAIKEHDEVAIIEREIDPAAYLSPQDLKRWY